MIPKNIEINQISYSQAGRTDKKVSSIGNVISLKLYINESKE
jgi:tRNA U38,U39,U40 pseudouridine synthase TruA